MQNNAVLIYFAAEAWNHAYLTTYPEQEIVTKWDSHKIEQDQNGDVPQTLYSTSFYYPEILKQNNTNPHLTIF